CVELARESQRNDCDQRNVRQVDQGCFNALSQSRPLIFEEQSDSKWQEHRQHKWSGDGMGIDADSGLQQGQDKWQVSDGDDQEHYQNSSTERRIAAAYLRELDGEGRARRRSYQDQTDGQWLMKRKELHDQDG